MKEAETTNLNILVVDDQQLNLDIIEKILLSMPVNIFSATSGEKALKYALKYDFAIILLDVQMPEMDGFETATLLRNNEKTKHTPIIFVTAMGYDSEYLKKGYSSGAVDYMLKPVTPYILKSKVNIFLDLYNQKILINDQKKLLDKRNKELRKTLDEIRALQGLIPICAWCKNMRNDEGYWEKVEEYVGRISAAEFTHGICPECFKKMKADMKESKKTE